MRRIEIPEPVALVSLAGRPILEREGGPQKRIAFNDWCVSLLTDRAFGADMESVFAAVEIRDSIKKANGVLELPEAHWNRLVTVVRKPSAPYVPDVAHNVAGFMRAVVEAEVVDS